MDAPAPRDFLDGVVAVELGETVIGVTRHFIRAVAPVELSAYAVSEVFREASREWTSALISASDLPAILAALSAATSRAGHPTLRSTYLDMAPLELATFCGLEPAVRQLQGYPVTTPHPTGMSSLWLACASRLAESTALESVNRELVNRPNVNSIWRNATPLMMAAGHAAHFLVCDRLLGAGADPNAGTSILHAACDWHFEHLILGLQYLSRVGWKVDSPDSIGQTALHKAAFLGYSTAVTTLLRIGANPNAMDATGRRPLDLARERNKSGVVKTFARAT